MLLSLVGEVLTETGQTVRVRHVGEGSIAAGTVVTPEPCGQLGLCYTKSAEIVRTAPYPHRFAKAVGPIAGELGTENTDWQFGSFQNHPWSQPTTGWYAENDFSAAPTISGPLFLQTWTLKMKPFRWKAWGYGEAYYGGVRMQRAVASRRPPVPFEEWATGLYGATSATYPTFGLQPQVAEEYHYSPTTADRVHLPNGLRFTRFPRLFPFSRTDVEEQITHYRIWIDGVDKTGIRTGNLPFALGGFAGIPLDSYEGKQIEFDVWLTYTITDSGVVDDAARQVAWVDNFAGCKPILLQPTTTQAVSSDYDSRFLFEFDAYGPESLTELATATDPATGWTLREWPSVNGVGVEKTGVGILLMDWWRREIPWLTYAPSGANATFVYMPADNGKFEPLRCENGAAVTVGTWTPSTPTDFKIIGAIRYNAQFPYGIFDVKGSGGLVTLDDLYANRPAVITVTKTA
jgi:hypothetical protein